MNSKTTPAMMKMVVKVMTIAVDYSINSGSPAFWFFMVMLDSNNDSDFASNLVDYT